MTQNSTLERSVATAPPGSCHVFVLAVVQGADPNAVYRIESPGSVIGRDGDADVILADPEVSTRHCQLRVDGPICTIRDLGSLNGTVLNGHPMRPDLTRRLRHLDEIKVGSTRLLVLGGRFKPGRATG